MIITSSKGRTLEHGSVPLGEQIAEVACHNFGAYPQKVILIPTFEDTLVYEIRFPYAQYVLKTMGKDRRDAVEIAVEGRVGALARARGAPVPKMVVLDESKKVFPKVYFIMQKVRGIPFRKARFPDDLNAIVLSRVGEVLRLLHSVKLPGYGKPDLERYRRSGQINGSSPTWNSYLCDHAKSDLDYLRSSGLLDAAVIAEIAELIPRYDQVTLESRESVLLHGDFTMDHVWVDLNTCNVSAIIDFGDALIGDPIWDFVSSDWERAGALEWLLKGYEPSRISREIFWSRLKIYKVIYTMSILVWGHKRKGIDLSSFVSDLHIYVRNAKGSV